MKISGRKDTKIQIKSLYLKSVKMGALREPELLKLKV